MANVLVAYATRQGQTEKIAQRVAAVLRELGHEVELIDTDRAPRSLDTGLFQFALVGAPIHAGGYPRSAVRFVREHLEFLNSIPSAFFSVGLAVASRNHDGEAQTRPLVERFMERTGWRPAHVELVAGALVYSKYNFLIRFIMKRISAKEGGQTDTSRDYEYTDWAAVDRFARSFVPERARELRV